MVRREIKEKREEEDAYFWSNGWNAGFMAAINVLRRHYLKETKEKKAL